MTEPNGTPEPLSADQGELQRRYRLSDEDVRRVRGEDWDAQCRDAERLSNLSEPQSIYERAMRELEAQGNPNATELAGMSAMHEQHPHRALLEMLHPPTKKAEGGEES